MEIRPNEPFQLDPSNVKVIDDGSAPEILVDGLLSIQLQGGIFKVAFCSDQMRHGEPAVTRSVNLRLCVMPEMAMNIGQALVHSAHEIMSKAASDMLAAAEAQENQASLKRK